MAPRLIEQIKLIFRQDVLIKAADYLGEREQHIELAMEAAIPAILTGLVRKYSSSGQTGMVNMVSTAEHILGDPSHLRVNLKGLFADYNDPNGLRLLERTGGLLENIFGPRLRPVAEALSVFSGIKPSSAHRLLAVAGTVTVMVTGQYMDEYQLNEREMMNQLVLQKKELIHQVPDGLNLAAALGLGDLFDMDTQARVPQHDPVAADLIVRGKRQRRLFLIIIMILLIIAAIMAWRNYEAKERHTRRPDTAQQF